jgi:uncharacterized protein YjbJ (UPF0337 family)
MNVDMLKGQWKQIKGGIKAKWGKITDDDLTAIEGNEEKLLGILQERYGYSREEAQKEYKKFMERKLKKAA